MPARRLGTTSDENGRARLPPSRCAQPRLGGSLALPQNAILIGETVP